MLALKRLFAIVILVFAGVGLAQTTANPAYAPVVDASNRFAVKFFKAAFRQDENVITSPASLSYVFSLLLNGATGDGRDELAEAFEFKDLDAARVNDGNAALRAIRRSHVVKPIPTMVFVHELRGPDGRSFQPSRLRTAMWFPKGYPTQTFQAVNKTNYGAALFARQPTTGAVRDWLAGVNGQPSKPSAEKMPQDFTIATVLDFESRWIQPFDPKNTHDGEFKLISGSERPVRLMHREYFQFRYLRGEKFQAIRLEFYDAFIYIFLPDEDSNLSKFVNSLTVEKWQDYLNKFDPHDGVLELPRFAVHQRRDNVSVLQRMGVRAAFAELPTFAPMVGPEGAVLTRALEVDSMQIDEIGVKLKTEAFMGGVIGGICGNCPPPPPPFRMIVDHPFFFAIVDARTAQTLFMGSIVDPSPEGAERTLGKRQ